MVAVPREPGAAARPAPLKRAARQVAAHRTPVKDNGALTEDVLADIESAALVRARVGRASGREKKAYAVDVRAGNTPDALVNAGRKATEKDAQRAATGKGRAKEVVF